MTAERERFENAKSAARAALQAIESAEDAVSGNAQVGACRSAIASLRDGVRETQAIVAEEQGQGEQPQ